MAGGSNGAVVIRWNGRRRRVDRDRNLASSLADGESPLLQRSVRYHRPRAPFCGIGACTNCLVRVNGVPNVRACRYRPSGSDRVESENAWPSPRFDLLGILDRLFPSGLDAVRGFRSPGFARPLYARVIRRLAAFGRIPDPGSGSVPQPVEQRTTEFLVVGGGPSGRAAAERLRRTGASPLLIDRGEPIGLSAGVEVLPRTTAAFLPPPEPDSAHPFELLAASESGGARLFRARRVILATGTYDAGLWFPGSDLPGVMTGEGAESLEGSDHRPPFQRAVLFGGGSRAASLLERWSVGVEAVAAPGPISPEVVRRASDLGIPLYPRSLLARAIGRRRVRAVELLGRAGGPPTRIVADSVLLAHRSLPHNPLLFQSGAVTEWHPSPGAYFPRRAGTASTVPGLLIAGALAGGPGGSGLEAAERAMSGDPWPVEFDPPPASAPSEMEGYYRELLGLPGTHHRWTACACEDVRLSELEDAHRRGYRGIEVIKRYTGLGTGLCQGRYCLPEALVALSIWERRPPFEVGYITQRPPVFPVSLGALADLPSEPGG